MAKKTTFTKQSMPTKGGNQRGIPMKGGSGGMRHPAGAPAKKGGQFKKQRTAGYE